MSKDVLITMSDEQFDILADRAAKKGITVSELIRRDVSLGILLDKQREDSNPIQATPTKCLAFLGVEPVEGRKERFVYTFELPHGLPNGQVVVVGSQVNLQPIAGEPPMEFEVISVKSPNANGSAEIILNRWLSGSSRFHYWSHVLETHYGAQHESTALEGYEL